MVQRLIDLSLRNRGVVLGVYLLFAAWGYHALITASVDAIPDLSDNQVIVFTDWPATARRKSKTRSRTR